MENPAFHRNENKNRFELSVDNHIAFIDYVIQKDTIMTLTHTEVPKALGGKGVGKSIVESTLNYLKDNGFAVVPECPFITSYIKRNPQWQSMLSENNEMK